MPLLPVNRAANDTRGGKKISGQRVSGGDAPVVNPGLARARPLNAPSGAFDSGLSQITQEIAPELKSAGDSFKKREILEEKKLAEVAALQQTRTDILERVRIRQNYRKSSEKFKVDFSAENDLSDPKHAATLNKRIVEMRGETLSDFAGSDLGLANATKDLDTMEAAWTQKLAEETTAAQLKRLDKEVARELAPLDNEITGATTMAEYNEALVAGDELIDGFADAEPEMLTIKRRQSQRSHIATMMVQKALNTGNAGNIERAELLLKSGGISKELSKEDRNSLRSKIQTAKNQRRSIQDDAERAGAMERAKLQARAGVVHEVLSSHGLPGLNGASNVEPNAIANPLGEGVETTSDYKDASRLFVSARALFAAGLNSEANGMMAQAKFIIENSTDIQEQKELDKPVSPELASELGVPLGATMRSVIGQIPDSPTEKARDSARASAKGKEEVKGEATILFIDDASDTIGNLLEEIENDPIALVGATGGLRATGKNMAGILGDLGGQAIVDAAQEMAFTESDLSSSMMGDLFDNENLSLLGVMENSLGLVLARLRTPEGRIPVDIIRRSIEDVNLTGLNSQEKIVTKLKWIKKQLQKRKEGIQKRFAPEGVNEPGESKPTHRVVDGKIVPIVDEGDDDLKKKVTSKFEVTSPHVKNNEGGIGQARHQPDQGEKGPGFIEGIHFDKDDKRMTEVTIGIKLDGKEVDVPLINGLTTKADMKVIASGKIDPVIDAKAELFALARIAEDRSIFLEKGEKQIPLEFKLTKLKPAKEKEFQAWIKKQPWHKEFKKDKGEFPNLDTKAFDYRGAWQDGETPTRSTVDNKLHWGSKFKATDHPTKWKDTFMTASGGIDPDDVGVKTVIEGLAWLKNQKKAK